MPIAVIIAAVLLVRHRKSELANLTPPALPPIPVHIQTATSGSLSITEQYLGTIEPVVEAILSAQATGYLISMEKNVGDRVTTGENGYGVRLQFDPETMNTVTDLSFSQIREANGTVPLKEIAQIRPVWHQSKITRQGFLPMLYLVTDQIKAKTISPSNDYYFK